MTLVKEIILNNTGSYAIVVDSNDDQWYCHYSKHDNISVSDYLIDVYQYFQKNRSEYFNCDIA